MLNKYTPKPELRRWLDEATPLQKRELCELADTSITMLRQWVIGRRNLSAEKAGRVCEAMVSMYTKRPKKTPVPLSKGQLCDACATCSYFKKGK